MECPLTWWCSVVLYKGPCDTGAWENQQQPTTATTTNNNNEDDDDDNDDDNNDDVELKTARKDFMYFYTIFSNDSRSERWFGEI